MMESNKKSLRKISTLERAICSQSQISLNQKAHLDCYLIQIQPLQIDSDKSCHIINLDESQKLKERPEKHDVSYEQSFVVQVMKNQSLLVPSQYLGHDLDNQNFDGLTKRFINLRNAINYSNKIEIQSQKLSINQKPREQQFQNENYSLSDIFKDFPLHQSHNQIEKPMIFYYRDNKKNQLNAQNRKDNNNNPQEQKVLEQIQEKIADIDQAYVSVEEPNQIVQPQIVDPGIQILQNEQNKQQKTQKSNKKLSSRIKKRCKYWTQMKAQRKLKNKREINQKAHENIENIAQQMQQEEQLLSSNDLLHHFGYSINNKNKKIKNLSKEKRKMKRQAKVIEQFKRSVSIVGERCSYGNNKEYRWEIVSKRVWNTLSEALHANFHIFLKLSRQYKSTFIKYLPKNLKSKKQKQQSKINSKTSKKIKKAEKKQAQKTEVNSEHKLQDTRRQMIYLKQVFNKIQIQKVGQYQQKIKQNLHHHDLQSDVQSQFNVDTQFEPQCYELNKMVHQIIKKDNENLRKKYRIQGFKVECPYLTPINESIRQNIEKIVEEYDYRNNINNFFNINKERPLLSCLGHQSLGLRSQNLKLISKETFHTQMKKLRQQKDGIIIQEANAQRQSRTTSQIKIE